MIDYSRCIILPDKIENLHDKSLPKSYTIIKNLNEFHKNQVEMLLRLYIHYTSDSEHSKDELRILFRNKFEAVFKLLSVTDVYGFTQKMLMVFKLNESNVIKPHKQNIELLQKINKRAGRFLIEEMNNLISNTAYEETISKMEWPILTVIKSCFGEYLISDKTTIGNIVDVFDVNNELKYSLTKYDKFPEIISNPKSIVGSKIIDLSNNPGVKLLSKVRIEHEAEKNKGMKIVNYIATRQKEKHF